MSAPEESPAAPAPAGPSRFDAALLRFGRFADRTKLLTVGGWGLFGVSTVLGAALAVPPGEGAAAVAVIPAVAAPPPIASAPPRTAAVERNWPAVPDRFDPPPADWAANPPPPAAPFPPDAAAPAPAAPPFVADEAPWDAALADLPPAVREDLAAVRDRFGSVTDRLPGLPGDLPPDFAASPGSPLAAEPVSLRSGGDVDLGGLRHAAAVCRHNLANAFTPGYRRLEPVCEERPDLGGAAAAGTRVDDAAGEPAAGGSNVRVADELARLTEIERLLALLDPAPARVAARR